MDGAGRGLGTHWGISLGGSYTKILESKHKIIRTARSTRHVTFFFVLLYIPWFDFLLFYLYFFLAGGTLGDSSLFLSNFVCS